MKDRNDSDGDYYYRALFSKADKEKKGLISYNELNKILKQNGYISCEAELQDLVNNVDINENGEIDVESFLDIISKCQENEGIEKEIFDVFKIFDINKTKKLSPKNVLSIFSKIDENIKEEEVLQIFKEYDLDKDGYLNYEEFCRMIKNK